MGNGMQKHSIKKLPIREPHSIHMAHTAKAPTGPSPRVRMQQQSASANKTLMASPNAETKASLAGTQALQSSSAEELYHQQLQYSKRIEWERRKIHDLDRMLQKTKSAILDLQRNLGGEYTRRENQNGVKRRISRQEDKLENTLAKRNLTRNGNEALRKNIDNLRREKAQQSHILARLERDLKSREATLTHTIKAKHSMMETKEAVGRDLERMKQTALEELDGYSHEFEEASVALRRGGDELSRTHTHTSTLLGSPISPRKERPVVSSTRNMGASASAKESMTQPASPVAGATGGPEGEKSTELKTQVNKSFWVVAKTQMDLEKAIDRKEALQGAVSKILEETKCESLDDLVPALLGAEEAHYNYYREISELNEELEGFELERIQIKKDFETLRVKVASQAAERKAVEDDLEAQIAAQVEQKRLYDKDWSAIAKIIDGVRPQLLASFQKIGCCDEARGAQMYANGLTERNAAKFLSMIEDRLQEMMHVEAAIGANPHGDAAAGGAAALDAARPSTPKLGPKGTRVPVVAAPEPPSAFDMLDYDDDGDDDAVVPIQVSRLTQEIDKAKGKSSLGGAAGRSPRSGGKPHASPHKGKGRAGDLSPKQASPR